MNIDLGESHMYLGCITGGVVGKPFFCGAGLTRCAIMPNGDVLGCQQVYDGRYAEGNIRNDPFSYIWKQRFKQFRKERVIPGYCTGCRSLSVCGGGCWAEMLTQKKCLKYLWENNETN